MSNFIEILGQSFDLRWEVIDSFEPDQKRRRSHDSILDLGCWRTEIDLSELDSEILKWMPGKIRTPIIIAGKPGAPDSDAIALAKLVVANTVRLLTPLGSLGPTMEFGADNWGLEALWFPFQSCGQYWFAEFTTEYDGEISYAFSSTTVNGQIETASLRSTDQPSLIAAPALIRQCISSLHKAKCPDPLYGEVLRRIEVDGIFGPEVLPDFREIVSRSNTYLPDWERKHLNQLLADVSDSME